MSLTATPDNKFELVLKNLLCGGELYFWNVILIIVLEKPTFFVYIS